MPLEPAIIIGGERINAHPKSRCARDERCAVHKPSTHSMSKFPQHWRDDRGLMERVCPHGVGHPDPDHLHFVADRFGKNAARVESVHGCDGCCAPQNTPTHLIEAQWSPITPENAPFPEKE